MTYIHYRGAPCAGPCQSWCSCPLYVAFLAYAALAYAIASLNYLWITRSYGTPFYDSLTPEQRKLKACSVGLRYQAFKRSLGTAVLLLCIWRPIA